MSRPIICPSILASDMSRLKDEAQRMIDDLCDWLHLDVMDGHFVPNISFGPSTVSALRRHFPEAILDVHLMVTNPEQWVEPMAKAGATNFTFHFEAVDSDNAKAAALAYVVKSAGMRVGLAIKPKTQVEDVKDVVKSGCIDMLLVMTVEPGFGGQSFLESQMETVKKARTLFPNLDIQVDGGLDKDTIRLAANAGANVIVSGTGLYKCENPRVMMEYMRDVIVSEMV